MSKENKINKFSSVKEYIKKYSIKLKNSEQMFSFLDKAFAKIENFEFGYFQVESREELYLGGRGNIQTIFCSSELSILRGTDKKIGQCFSILDEQYTLIPLFETEIQLEILVVKNDPAFISFFKEELLPAIENINIYRQLKNKCMELTGLSHVDEVTGIFNQRKLIKDLEEDIKTHTLEKKNFSLMFVDIDHFKYVNDTYGHLIGSEILEELGRLLKSLVRSSDDVYRFGGDEFIIVLRNVSIEIVHSISIRTLESIKAKEFLIDGNGKYKMSVSIGIAEFPTDADTTKKMIQLADSMMYESKKSGRGKVIHLGKEVKKC